MGKVHKAKPGKKERQEKKEAAAKAASGDVEAPTNAEAKDRPDGQEEGSKKKTLKDFKAVRTGSTAGAGDDEEASPKKKRRKDDAAAGEAEVEESAEAAAAKAESLVSDEQRRKQQQELQQLVVKMRSDGMNEQEIGEAKRKMKNSFGQSAVKPDGRRVEKWTAWQAWNSAHPEEATPKTERQEKLERVHDLVIIPVVWRGRHDSGDVSKAAEDIKAILAQQGVDTWIDSRRQLTPGQKFAHWEHRGVMTRIEVGPEDVKKGICRICKAKLAGDYQSVERKQVRLPPKGARALLLALKEFGMKIDIERREGDSDNEGDAPVEAVAPAKGAAEDEDAEGNYVPRMPSAAEVKEKKKSKAIEGGAKKKKKRV